MQASSSHSNSTSTDTALLEALRRDDESAFAEIYKRYCYQLFAVAYHKLKSREIAEELVQDLFESLWNRRATHQIQQLEQYLFRALRYQIINYVKSQKLRAGYELYHCMYQPGADTNTEDLLALADLRTALEKNVHRLPEKSRQVFQLSREDHYTVTEISARLNLSEKAIEYHLTKSLRLLRTYLREFLLIITPLFLF